MLKECGVHSHCDVFEWHEINFIDCLCQSHPLSLARSPNYSGWVCLCFTRAVNKSNSVGFSSIAIASTHVYLSCAQYNLPFFPRFFSFFSFFFFFHKKNWYREKIAQRRKKNAKRNWKMSKCHLCQSRDEYLTFYTAFDRLIESIKSARAMCYRRKQSPCFHSRKCIIIWMLVRCGMVNVFNTHITKANRRKWQQKVCVFFLKWNSRNGNKSAK